MNSLSNANLALMPETQAISKSAYFGSLCGLNCSDQLNRGNPGNSKDDFDEESKILDWWGYVWPQPYHINRVVYETGNIFPEGGWYASGLRVQVRQNFQWIDVSGITISPVYPYTVLRVITLPTPLAYLGRRRAYHRNAGGTSHFTSISRLGIYYVNQRAHP